MCGISGVFKFNEGDIRELQALSQSFRKKLHSRGPDSNGDFIHWNVLLAHNRLSVIDTSEKASQPMSSEDGKYTIVFNGEIFNFKHLRTELQDKGYVFCSQSDTEVVLKLYMEYGVDFLAMLNGFFALAIYDNEKNQLIVARDRFGIKPLIFYKNDEMFTFSSEMKALLEATGPQELDHASLRMYFRLTYIPPPYSIFKNVKKLIPGCYLMVTQEGVEQRSYFQIAENRHKTVVGADYETACKELYSLMEKSVSGQLISDVPLGCFLSGGIDSSVVTALAAKHTKGLKTFSIGFKDEPYYDETAFASLVAEKHQTEHTEFILSNDDLFEAVEGMLEYIDEPFADSSALVVNILSGQTRKHVTVALSGDGADEMFGGYNKHIAEQRIRRRLFSDRMLSSSSFLWNMFPASRGNKFSDKARKVQKYLKVLKLSPKDRYRFLSSFNDVSTVERLIISYGIETDFNERWEAIASEIDIDKPGIEDVMISDMQLVLPGDMLPKVDMMSMNHSLEVRPPFLDNSVVDFAFSIPTEFKIKANVNKRILRDTFAKELPAEVLNRSKQGFEVPMNTWFKREMRPMIDTYLHSFDLISQQKLFRHDIIKQLTDTVFSSRHHDLQSFIWSLLVFQYWYVKYENFIKKDWI